MLQGKLFAKITKPNVSKFQSSWENFQLILTGITCLWPLRLFPWMVH